MLKNFTTWQEIDFKETPHGGIKLGARVECRPCPREYQTHCDVARGKLGTVKRVSVWANDVVRVLWDGVSDDPFCDNAKPINVRDLVLLKQGA